MKCASGASFLPRLVCPLPLRNRSQARRPAWNSPAGAGGAVEWKTPLFAEADCLTATGSDETLAAIRARLPARVRFMGYGQRVSFGYRHPRSAARRRLLPSRCQRGGRRDRLGPEWLSFAAGDLCGGTRRGGVGSICLEACRRACAPRSGRTARQRFQPKKPSAIASRRAICETLAAHRADVKLWTSPDSTAWTVVFEHDVRFQFSPLNRFIYVKPVPDLAAVCRVPMTCAKRSPPSASAHRPREAKEPGSGIWRAGGRRGFVRRPDAKTAADLASRRPPGPRRPGHLDRF